MNDKLRDFKQVQEVHKKRFDIKKIKKYYIMQLQFHGM
jgi:hypothetical protein